MIAEERARIVVVCRSQGWADDMLAKMDAINQDHLESADAEGLGCPWEAGAQILTNEIVAAFFGLEP